MNRLRGTCCRSCCLRRRPHWRRWGRRKTFLRCLVCPDPLWCARFLRCRRSPPRSEGASRMWQVSSLFAGSLLRLRRPPCLRRKSLHLVLLPLPHLQMDPWNRRLLVIPSCLRPRHPRQGRFLDLRIENTSCDVHWRSCAKTLPQAVPERTRRRPLLK